jgi:hypothetical protein
MFAETPTYRKNWYSEAQGRIGIEQYGWVYCLV